MNHFLIFGTHPRLSLAELRAVRPDLAPPLCIGSAVACETGEWDGAVLMNRLGGTVKLGDIIGDLPLAACSAADIAGMLSDRIPTRSFDFGWTVFANAKATKQKLSKLAIAFKKEMKARGIGSRWVTGDQTTELSPAAVAKLKLTTEGLDLCLSVDDGRVLIGLTTDVQDADAWGLRDFGRPRRDNENGMLPPKLARMMVNLAQVPHGGTLLDPFCGGGTVLMEGALATDAAHLIGSDNDAKQVGDTIANNAWLIEKKIARADDAGRFRAFLSDVKKVSQHLAPASVDRIVTEGFLGPPLRGHETAVMLEKNTREITRLWIDTLTALRPILKSRGRIVSIWPAFKSAHGMARVDLTDHLNRLGYHMVDALGDWETSKGPLIYQRPDQRVSRRIVIIE